MSRFMKSAAVCLAAIASLGAGLAANRMSAQAAAPESSAASLYDKTFPDAAGKMHPMSDLKGHLVVVNFWATWCVPCVKEIPELSKISTGYGKKVQFVGIGIDSADKIAEFQQNSPVSYPLLVAKVDGSDLVREFGDNAGGLPFTIVIDQKGVIRDTKLGPIDEAELRQWLKSLGA